MWLSKYLKRVQKPQDSPPPFPLSFYNTLGKEKQLFTQSDNSRLVRMYNCGPTLYGRQHIGNLSMFVFADVLRRTLEYNGYSVKQVINFTDFGHLSSDADDGEDKMTTGLKREKLALTMENMRALAEKYAAVFLEDLVTLNVATHKILFPYASDYVKTQIALIRTLEEKGYAYKADDGVYFDTSRFAQYGELGGINTGTSENRVEVRSSKRNPNDFVLWKSTSSKKLGWDSHWGRGFPGWHIECSGMARALLGEKIDIHTGGIEHISIHHNNEIAQSECASGKRPFSRFWMHRAHIQMNGKKIAKSVGNVLYLSPDITNTHHPLALRYLFLSAHYRTAMNFTPDSLDAAQTAFLKLRALVDQYPDNGSVIESYRTRMHERINDDVDTPGALAIAWEMIKDTTQSPADIRATILNIDSVFGLNLGEKDVRAESLYSALFGKTVATDDIPPEVQTLVSRREEARERKAWDEADSLRAEVELLGYSIDDAPEGTRVLKRT